MSIITNFGGKIMSVLHHLLDAMGNSGYESPFREMHFPVKLQLIQSYHKDHYGQSVSEGWPYINIATSQANQKMHIKFYVDNKEPARSYSWNFGDDSYATTINKELEHIYDLTKKDEWLSNSGAIPIQGLYGYTGRWANVVLTITDLSGNRYSQTNEAFIYEITGGALDKDVWQGIDEIPITGVEVIQTTISTGDTIQTIDYF